MKAKKESTIGREREREREKCVEKRESVATNPEIRQKGIFVTQSGHELCIVDTIILVPLYLKKKEWFRRFGRKSMTQI